MTRRPAARHLRGALPASIRSPVLGDRGARPLPCSPSIQSPRGRHVVGIAVGETPRQRSTAATKGTPQDHAADMSSASRLHPRPSSVRRRQWVSESDGVQSLSRRAPLIGTGTGGLQGLRNTVQPPRRQLSAASSPCQVRPALSHRGSARRRCPPPLRGAGCRGTAGGQTGSGGRHVVGIAVRAGRPAAVN